MLPGCCESNPEPAKSRDHPAAYTCSMSFSFADYPTHQLRPPSPEFTFRTGAATSRSNQALAARSAHFTGQAWSNNAYRFGFQPGSDPQWQPRGCKIKDVRTLKHQRAVWSASRNSVVGPAPLMRSPLDQKALPEATARPMWAAHGYRPLVKPKKASHAIEFFQ